jgi:hypothetical protein
VSVWVALSLLNFQAPHFILGRSSSPAGSVEQGESAGTKLGGSQRSKCALLEEANHSFAWVSRRHSRESYAAVNEQAKIAHHHR